MRRWLLLGFILIALPFRTTAQEVVPADRLPFSTEETTGSLEVVARHRISWNRKSGELKWDRLNVEIPQVARLEVTPGSFTPGAAEDQTLGLHLDVRDGSIETQLTLRGDETWAAPADVRLGSRNLTWKDPRVEVRQVSLAGRLAVDTRLDSGPLKTLKTVELNELRIASLQAGAYDARDLALRGAWRRPAWTLERFEARTFGGRLWASGHGEWGTRERPVVSLEVGAEGIDLQDLLKAFKIGKADQVEARVAGRMLLEAEGRNWKLLNLDLVGEEGTVKLSRQLLYDILSPSMSEVLTKKQIDDALDSAFGRQQMIPFQRVSFEGGLRPETLNLRLPLQNEVLDLDIEPQIDRELLWDLWDELTQIGWENLRGLGSGGRQSGDSVSP